MHCLEEEKFETENVYFIEMKAKLKGTKEYSNTNSNTKEGKTVCEMLMCYTVLRIGLFSLKQTVESNTETDVLI